MPRATREGRSKDKELRAGFWKRCLSQKARIPNALEFRGTSGAYSKAQYGLAIVAISKLQVWEANER
jgi:hypothetical protein